MAGPKLPNTKGGGKVTKGEIKGVQDFDRNDLRKGYGGLKKASTRKTNSVNA